MCCPPRPTRPRPRWRWGGASQRTLKPVTCLGSFHSNGQTAYCTTTPCAWISSALSITRPGSVYVPAAMSSVSPPLAWLTAWPRSRRSRRPQHLDGAPLQVWPKPQVRQPARALHQRSGSLRPAHQPPDDQLYHRQRRLLLCLSDQLSPLSQPLQRLDATRRRVDGRDDPAGHHDAT